MTIPLQDRPAVDKALRVVAAPTCYHGCDCRRCHELRATLLAVLAAEVRKDMAEENAKLRAALTAMLNHYVSLVESGDAGNWDAETEEVVIQTRVLLTALPSVTPAPEGRDK